MAYTEYIEKVISCLMSDSDDLKVYRDKVRLCSLLNKVSNNNVGGIDYALVKMISNIYKIKIGTQDTNVRIPKESLERVISSSIQTVVYEKEFDMEGTIRENGLPFDMSIPKDAEASINHFYTEMLNSIDRIYEDDTTLTNALLELEALKESICDSKYKTMLMVQNEMYNSKGITEARKKGIELSNEISKLEAIRITCEDDMTVSITLDSYEKSKMFDESMRGRLKTLFSMGFEPYDRKMEFTNSDIALVIADINTGKTRLLIDQAYKCMMAGINCSIVCTETAKEEVKLKLELMHLYYLYGHTELNKIKLREIQESIDNGEESYTELSSQIEHCKADLYNSRKYGTVTIHTSFSYENSYEFFINEKNLNGSEVIFIDHTRSLSHEGKTPEGNYLKTEKESLAYLATQIKAARINKNIMFYLFSHTKSGYSDGASVEKVGTNANLAAGATEIAESATRTFWLTRTADESANDIVRIMEVKSREDRIDPKQYKILRLGSCGVHIYDEKIQIFGNEEYDSLDRLIEEE